MLTIAASPRCNARFGARLATVLIAIGLAQLVAACGASSVAARPAVCKLKAQQAIARDLGIKPGSIAYTHSIANNAMPQCAFRARAGGRKVVVTVNVDNGPQPYFRLGRTINEATQIFGAPPPGFRAPEGLSGLFPFASWFPNTDQLMAMNYRVLVTVTVGWPGAGRNAEVAVARAAAVPYLPRPHGPLNAILYP